MPATFFLVGKPFTFTNAEKSQLLQHLDSARFHLENQRSGWKVLMVKEITQANRVIHAALERGHESSN